MIKNITSIDSHSGIKIEGIKYVIPIAINYYDIYLVVENENWVLKSIELTLVALKFPLSKKLLKTNSNFYFNIHLFIKLSLPILI